MNLKLKINIPAWILLIWAVLILFGNLETWYDYQEVVLRIMAIVVMIYLVMKDCCTVKSPEVKNDGKSEE